MPITPLAITAGAWAWDKYGKTLTDKAVGGVRGHWDKFRWNEAAEKYRAKIKKLYGTMQIMGMPEPVPLDDIFTEAYLLDKPAAFSRFDIEYLKKLSADPDVTPPKAKRVSGLTLVKRNKNLFILGKPGAGKTTFLKYIAVQAAEPKKPIIDKVPLFISLKSWADSGKELMPFIEEQFDKCDFPAARLFVEELLKTGNAIVLFDGLDEVNQEGGQRDNQTLAINNFIEKYDRTQCLITCRIAASDYSFKPFTYVEIADFTQQQIEKFVRNWFRNQEGEQDEETSKRFLTEFGKEDNKGLRDLARTPLLLTLLCLSFNETLTFPQRRAEIYQEALDALLKKWDSSRRIKRDDVYRKLSLGHKVNMLARIAAETFEKNEYFIPQPQLERLITNFVKNVPPHDTNDTADGETILKSIEAQHGIFVERAHKIYSFSHLTFQEYFTAKYIVDNATEGTLTNLINAHCTDPRWREVFLLTTSLLPDAGQFIATFRRRVDELLEDDEKLKGLLAWADRKSTSYQDDILSLVDSASDSILPDPWFVRGYNLHIALLHTGIFINSLLYTFSSGSLRVNLDYGLFRILQNATGRTHPLSYQHIDIITHYYDSVVEAAREFELDDLEKDFTALHTPTESATAAEWQVYAENLRALMIKHRDIGHEWGFGEKQKRQLKDYFAATRLLKDCLELAVMPPEEKKAVLDSLFLPPGKVGGEKGV
jgi:hypothetical protein